MVAIPARGHLRDICGTGGVLPPGLPRLAAGATFYRREEPHSVDEGDHCGAGKGLKELEWESEGATVEEGICDCRCLR